MHGAINASGSILSTFHALTQGVRKDPQNIFENVREIYPDITRKMLEGKDRTSRVSHARHMAFFALHGPGGLSYPEIGNMFGGRDHVTVLYGDRRIKEELKSHGVDPSIFRENVQNGVLIEDCRNSLYNLGAVEIFGSIEEGMTTFDSLRDAYGYKSVRSGPAIVESKKLIDSPLSAGIYLHQQTVLSDEDKRARAPLLGTIHSLTLEEALKLKSA